MITLLMVLGCLLLVLGVPISIITTIVFAVKKKRVKIPAICIPVSLVLSLICLIVGGTMYAKTDEYKEAAAKTEKEQAEKEKAEKEQAKKEKAKKKKARQEQKKAKKEKEEKAKAEEKEEPTPEPTQEVQEAQETSNEAENKPEPVPVENSVVLYYMDLYENCENYNGQYVTISAPISSANEDSVTIRGDIEGITGMIDVTLIEPRNDLNPGDFITVTGCVGNKTLGCLFISDANISQTGEASAQICSQQKAEYDSASAQKAVNDIEDFKASCESLNYEDILRNPDENNGKNCVVSGTVDQIIEGWFDSFTIFVTDSAGNKWGCVYSYKDGESRLLEGDGVTMYGTCKGTENTKTLLGQQVTLPRVDVEYIN